MLGVQGSPDPLSREPLSVMEAHAVPESGQVSFHAGPPSSSGANRKAVHAPRLRCAGCGTSNPRDARFCAECGQRLHHVHPPTDGVLAPEGASSPREPVSAPVVCPRCRGANPLGPNECQFCEASLVPVPVPSPESAIRLDGRSEPEKAKVPRLVVISQDGSAGREYRLSADQTDVGRAEGGVLLADDPYVSPRHARLIRRGDKLFIRDLGSVNRVYVRLRKAYSLKDGDLVLLGLQVLRFEIVSDAEQGLGPAEEQGTRVFGCPASPRYARLCQRTVEGVSRDVHYLTRNQMVLGREHGDVVFSSDAFMSRRHAVIARDPDHRQFMLRDLGSSNGTYVAIRHEQELREGDHLRIGQHLFRLDIDRRTRPI